MSAATITQPNTHKHNKVAEITLLFWVMKILATTLGETLGDHLSMTLNLGYLASLWLTLFLFLVALGTQLKINKYHPALYWLVIIGTTTVGTEISDCMDRSLGLGYTAGSLVLIAGLLFTLGAWYYREKSITVYPITLPRIELFYWIAILWSNSLGTAFGDYLSDDIGLSYGMGALVTAGVIALVVLLHYFSSLNQSLLFWIAFIFTRPFGATFGDLLTKSTAQGGLNLGTVEASLVTAGLLLLLIGLSTYLHHQKQKN